jgi:DNA-binding transcriptional ArsR family regulator|tara:strand:- start:9706 stop:10083 length:378 start_codon:yes stop_codon:yes gene_type:complete
MASDSPENMLDADAPVCEEHHSPSTNEGFYPLEVEESQQMAEFFSVLADPTRLRLISLLSVSESCVCDLAAKLSVSESAVSHQLRALRNGRLVRYRKSGRQVFYSLHDHHIFELYETVRGYLAES